MSAGDGPAAVTRFARRAGELLAMLTALAVPLAGRGTPESIEAGQALVLAALGSAAGLCALALPHGAHAGARPRWLALALLGWCLLATLGSPYREAAATDLLVSLGAVGVGLSALRVGPRRIAAAALVAAAVAGAVALLPPVVGGQDLATLRPQGSFASAEVLGMALAAPAAAMILLALGAGSRLWTLPALIASAGVIASLSRGAMAALGAGLLIGLGARAGRRSALALGVLGLSIAVAAGALLATGRGELLLRRANLLSEARAEVTPSRLSLLGMGLGRVAARPWLGYGPGTFPLLAPSLTIAERGAGRLGADVEPWLHVQNDVVEVAAGIGIPGVLLAVVLAGLALARAWRGRHRPEGGVILAALVASLASAALHHPAEAAASRLVLAVAIGAALAAPAVALPQARPQHLAPLAALGLLAALLVRAWPFDPFGGLALRRAFALTLEGQHRPALAAWRRYARAAPPGAQSRVRLARAEAAAGNWNEAEWLLHAVLADWPRDPGAHLALGELLHQTGREAEALGALSQVRSGKLAQRARHLESVIRAGQLLPMAPRSDL